MLFDPRTMSASSLIFKKVCSYWIVSAVLSPFWHSNSCLVNWHSIPIWVAHWPSAFRLSICRDCIDHTSSAARPPPFKSSNCSAGLFGWALARRLWWWFGWFIGVTRARVQLLQPIPQYRPQSSGCCVWIILFFFFFYVLFSAYFSFADRVAVS